MTEAVMDAAKEEPLAAPDSAMDIEESDDAVVEAPVAAKVEASEGAPEAKASAEPAPCRTLYVRNLDEKRKAKELRSLLHALFSAYGEIEWISAHKALKLRGQAFITFRDVESATAALRRLQGSQFLDRPLRMQYARQQTLRPLGRTAKRRERPNNAPKPPPSKKAKEPPNRVLFAQDVPPGDALQERCARFAGFVEIRAVPAKPNISFVEFASEQHAAVAVSALHGTVIKDGAPPLRLTYAKK